MCVGVCGCVRVCERVGVWVGVCGVCVYTIGRTDPNGTSGVGGGCQLKEKLRSQIFPK